MRDLMEDLILFVLDVGATGFGVWVSFMGMDWLLKRLDKSG